MFKCEFMSMCVCACVHVCVCVCVCACVCVCVCVQYLSVSVSGCPMKGLRSGESPMLIASLRLSKVM